MHLQFLQNDFKSDYLFLMCSVATSAVTSLSSPIQIAVLVYCDVLADFGAVPYSLISFISAALLQALLQVNTEPFRNAFSE